MKFISVLFCKNHQHQDARHHPGQSPEPMCAVPAALRARSRAQGGFGAGAPSQPGARWGSRAERALAGRHLESPATQTEKTAMQLSFLKAGNVLTGVSNFATAETAAWQHAGLTRVPAQWGLLTPEGARWISQHADPSAAFQFLH